MTNKTAIVDQLGPPEISEEERAAVLEGLTQAERGEFVPDDVVAAYFAKHRG